MEILDRIPVNQMHDWVVIPFLVLLFATLISWIICDNGDRPTKLSAIIITASFVVFLISMFAGLYTYHAYDSLVIRVDDSISFNSIATKYEITKKDKYSNIYYVKEYVNDSGN